MYTRKILYSLSFLILLIVESTASSPFVVAMYRTKGAYNTKYMPINIFIDDVHVVQLEERMLVWHTVHSNGFLSLTGHGSSISPAKINIEAQPNDTLYLRIGASSYGHGLVSIVHVTKDKMMIELSKLDEDYREERTEEKTGSPGNGGAGSGSSSSGFEKFGTGFLLSHQGYIITNYHVVDGAREIIVKGVNGSKENSIGATVVAQDKENDLAILKLKDAVEIDSVPYIVQPEMALLGEKIYVLGYPLKTTMGEDIKLVDGLISSRTGFESNINSYQISAPVQPGNSGAPLFGDRGNLIGVVNAKHSGAENANYAIKARYIYVLAAAVPGGVFINTKNRLLNKTFVQQVAVLQNFVYIIEVK